MPQGLPSDPLSTYELNELRAFLRENAAADAGKPISALEELRGFLTAVICTPEMLMPSAWLPIALGESGFQSVEQAQRLTPLILRLYNDVSNTLSDSQFLTLFKAQFGGSGASQPPQAVWCRGFIRGIALRADAWQVGEDDELSRGLLPIIALGGTHPQNALAEIARAHHEQFIKMLPASVALLYARMRRLSVAGKPVSAGRSVDVPPLPSYEDAELAARTVPELLQCMMQDEDRVPRNVIDECARRGPAMLDALGAKLEAPAFWSEDAGNGEWWLRLHAVMILGLVPGAAAGELLVIAMRHMAQKRDSDLQDWLAGSWPALFRNKPQCVIEKLQALCEDRWLDWYMRVNAVDPVVAAAETRGAPALDGALDWLAALIADEKEDRDVRLCAANVLLDFPRARHRALLDKLVASQSADDRYFAAEDVSKAYARGRDAPDWGRRSDPWEFYTPDAIAKRQVRWAEEAARQERGISDGDDDLLDDDDSPPIPYLRGTPKIGRNDPCPCGSGKKFKKCHGAPGAAPWLH